MQKARPKHLNLLVIKQPLPAVMSILHRVSGVFLFLFLAVMLCLLESSLGSQASFDAMRAVAAHPLMKLLIIVMVRFNARSNPVPSKTSRTVKS